MVMRTGGTEKGKEGRRIKRQRGRRIPSGLQLNSRNDLKGDVRSLCSFPKLYKV